MFVSVELDVAAEPCGWWWGRGCKGPALAQMFLQNDLKKDLRHRDP